MDWSSGYITQIDYTYGYYHELSPSLLRLACLSAGLAFPAAHQLTYLELGFGQGLSIGIHAAANEGEFWGTDFNPTQTAHAQALVSASASSANLLNDSFEELAARTNLPDFDIIALHGIWSWVSEQNRRTIVDIIRRKLKVGGIVYISYNCLPGWAPAMPLRHLMTLHAELAASDAGGLVAKIDGAVKFARQMVDAGAHYFKVNPAVAERLKLMAKQDRHYLAHEYFNLDWSVMSFKDVARLLEDAKLSFATSAHLLDHFDAINLSEEARKLLIEIKQPILYQSVRDYFVNQQFRCDIFVKGGRRLTPLERTETFYKQTFILVTNPDSIKMKVKTSLGEAQLQEHIYRPIIEVLAEQNFAPKLVADIAASTKLKSLPTVQLAQALLILTGAGCVHPAQEPSGKTRASCSALNEHFYDRARSSSSISFLASPVTGAGIPVARACQLFLLAMRQGKKLPVDQANFVWNLLSGQGQRLSKDDKPLETSEENVSELTRQAKDFGENYLPTLRALGIQ